MGIQIDAVSIHISTSIFFSFIPQDDVSGSAIFSVSKKYKHTGLSISERKGMWCIPTEDIQIISGMIKTEASLTNETNFDHGTYKHYKVKNTNDLELLPI